MIPKCKSGDIDASQTSRRSSRRMLCVLALVLLVVFGLNVYSKGQGALEGLELLFARIEVKSTSDTSVSVFVYMNGSDLESYYEAASDDLAEMIKAGTSEQVHVIIETLGTYQWGPVYSIASDHAQIYELSGRGLNLVRDDLDQLDATDPATLAQFLTWGIEAYPADRYILILWDHGAGPVYGFGYDENQPDPYAALTLDEICQALEEVGVRFDCIGMDACVMASLEVCFALSPWCDYTILSEDFEPLIGWYYTDWLRCLYKDTSADMETLAQTLIDSTVRACRTDYFNGGDIILTLFDESLCADLFDAWAAFAYANSETLMAQNFNTGLSSQGRTHPVFEHEEESDLQTDVYAGYYICDIGSLAASFEGDEATALEVFLEATILYSGATKADSVFCGLSVCLPYNDRTMYMDLYHVFLKSGIDSDYLSWLAELAGVDTISSHLARKPSMVDNQGSIVSDAHVA